MRVIVRARVPSFMLNCRPLLTRILPIVYMALLYSGLVLELMPATRTLLPLVNASSLVRSFVFAVICVPPFCEASFCAGQCPDATPHLLQPPGSVSHVGCNTRIY